MSTIPTFSKADTSRTIFLLSPARTDGKRAHQLTNPKAKFDLAKRLQQGEAIPIGTLFSFVSGLYFRGKMAYVQRFAQKGSAFAITSNQGLVSVDMPLTLTEFKSLSEVAIDIKNEAYRRPLEIDLAGWGKVEETKFILLGSIASPKYLKVLLPFLKGRLYVPKAFHSRGDMSRGSLMLRSAAEGQELEYELVPRIGG